MKKAVIIIITVIIVITLGLGFTFVYLYGPNFGVYLKKPDTLQYVEQALKFMDSQGIYSGSEEWENVKNEILSEADEKETFEETYPLLEKALKVAGGKHSKLIKPDKKTDKAEHYFSPECNMRSDGILVIRLPEFTGNKTEADSYVESVYETVRKYSDTLSGVVIDLRGNTGGDMGPMVASVSPFLPDGELMYFGIGQTEKPVILENGNVSGGGSAVSLEKPFKIEGVRVAVLQDNMTASSGEAVLICFRGLEYVKTFGAESAGYCSSNNIFKLYDGAKLQLTVGTDIARTGEVFCEDPIKPDVISSDPEAEAVQWLYSSGD